MRLVAFGEQAVQQRGLVVAHQDVKNDNTLSLPSVSFSER